MRLLCITTRMKSFFMWLLIRKQVTVWNTNGAYNPGTKMSGTFSRAQWNLQNV